MAVQREMDEKDGTIRIAWGGMRRGLDSLSSPIEISDGSFPTLTNLKTKGGILDREDGSTLHATGMVAPDNVAPFFFGRYNPASASLSGTYILAAANGNVYQWNGTAFVTVRSGLSTTTDLYWTGDQLSDYLVMGNPTDGTYKWDGASFLPIGAKSISTSATRATSGRRRARRRRRLNTLAKIRRSTSTDCEQSTAPASATGAAGSCAPIRLPRGSKSTI